MKIRSICHFFKVFRQEKKEDKLSNILSCVFPLNLLGARQLGELINAPIYYFTEKRLKCQNLIANFAIVLNFRIKRKEENVTVRLYWSQG